MNVVFYSDEINLRSGGPSGYVANLKSGLQVLGCRDVEVVSLNVPGWLRKILFLIPTKHWRSLLRKRVRRFLIAKSLRKVDWANVDSVTCHTCKDVLFIHDFIAKINKKILILQMSHSPVLPSIEKGLDDMGCFHDSRDSRRMAEWEMQSFRISDAIISPSQHAMDSYYRDSKEFLELRKKILICPTGSPGLIRLDKLEARKKLGLDTPYVIAYVGRHCSTKGYDDLISIGEKVLSKREDVTFVIAGNLSKLIRPLKHPRWRELGWQDPSVLLSAADILISAGKDSYFDLSIIESMSVGCHVIAHAVGGNLDLAQDNLVIELYDTHDSCINKIDGYLSLSNEERERRSALAIRSFDLNYSIIPFARRYVKMIDLLDGLMSS